MKRRSKGTAFDISIHGDQLEHNRIQLEHNLQHTELSFRLSSTSDDENNDDRRPYPHHAHDKSRRMDHSSVEYPRHLSEPSFHDYPSMIHRSTGDQFGDEDTNGQVHPWSYRTGDDEEGINPYGGETVSTVAHHASALTISAGLGGGRGARRDPSLSGAEYDPDRPLHAMISGVNSKHSMFDIDPSKSRFQGAASMTYDPLVVDSTAELDRILESGHAPPPSARSRSVRVTSPASSASSSVSDEEGGQEPVQSSSRPKLTDHLRHVSFSPKRPRSAQSSHSNPASPLARASRNLDDNNASMNMPTPRPMRRSNIFPSYASSPAQPEVRLQPATPSTAGSKFSRMARGINKELEATQNHLTAAQQRAADASAAATMARPASAPVERNPFHDIAYQFPDPPSSFRPTPRKGSMRDTSSRKVQLPDVTGLTNAVESPAKYGAEYYPYRADNRPRDSEARFVQTLSAVQAQLRDLQDENGISRRRVNELEMELEECKREVARERTRLIQREELNFQQRDSSMYAKPATSKGKGKARQGPAEIDDERLHERYKEAVDEKKGLFSLGIISLASSHGLFLEALEALINSLRSHLTRLTSELASHQDLLTELRNLRESDARALREKGAEIARLKEEVQRLAGEVEVLRGVVEEGLKERRASRDIQVENSEADVAMSQDLDQDEEDDEGLEQDEEVDDLTEDDEEKEREEDAEPFDPASIQDASSHANFGDKTMRTDIATLGSTNPGGGSMAGGRFVDDEALGRIAAEVQERRSNRSSSSTGSHTQRARSPSPSRRATVEDADEQEVPQAYLTRASYQSRLHNQSKVTVVQALPEPSSSRPSAPTPGHGARQYGRPQEHSQQHHHQQQPQTEPETPFPQIRGEQLERLFFSAPEHNARTCTVCYRRRHRTGAASPSWSHPKRTENVRNHNEEDDEEEDEGFGEGSEEAADTDRAARDKGKQRGYVTFSKDPGHWRQVGRQEGLPPQTVVARVIRELEDDFTHYKSVYVELADQYKVMDAVSDVPRRNMLARHLREVVDILEQKGDQIAALYDLLSFKDKPVGESVVPEQDKGRMTTSAATTSWGKSAASRRMS
ncbi:hypothetical protein B0H34DRAFT_464811 [Crassisporium funariophilum]|nr:hypothetical protein B0H34DRAFT_464811 [Crassisporium funariophilum]